MLDEYLAPLLPFLQDSSLTEICVNRPFEVWTEGRSGWSQHAVPYLSFAHCRQLATLIASFNGKAITFDRPVLSASLPTGERVQVLIPPACEAFTVSITVRKPSIIDKTLEELDLEGAFTACADVSDDLQPFEQELLRLKEQRSVMAFLDLAVRRHRNILIVGKTGSGKTTAILLVHCLIGNEIGEDYTIPAYGCRCFIAG